MIAWIKWLAFDLCELAGQWLVRYLRGVVRLDTKDPGVIASALYVVLAMEQTTVAEWAYIHAPDVPA